MSELAKCESCGMPIESGKYCQYCVDEEGNLQSFEERFAKMVNWMQGNDSGLSREEAEEKTKAYMGSMPAWKDHPGLNSE